MARCKHTLSASLVAVALGATACGSGSDDDGADAFADQSAEQIREDTIADMKKLKSLRMDGQITTDGEEVGLDLAMDKDGNCAGSVEMTGATAEFISNAEATFLKGDEAFWQETTGGGPQADAVMKLVGDKWAKLPPGQGSFESFCDIDSFLEELEDEDDETKDVEKAGEEEVDGTEAVVLSGKDEDDGTTKIWIASEGEHHILKMSNEGEDSPGEFTFSDFDEPVDADAPSADDVVDLAQLTS